MNVDSFAIDTFRIMIVLPLCMLPIMAMAAWIRFTVAKVHIPKLKGEGWLGGYSLAFWAASTIWACLNPSFPSSPFVDTWIILNIVIFGGNLGTCVIAGA
jgi:hypothetical protein